jgi:hypothetical protein
VKVRTADPAGDDVDLDEAFSSVRRYLANCDFLRSFEEGGAHQ